MNAAPAALRPMNWRAYFALVRIRSQLFFVAICVGNAFTFVPVVLALRRSTAGVNFIEAIGQSIVFPPTAWTGAQTFARMAVFLPMAIGVALNGIVRALQRWPTTLVLPHARRSFRRCHATVVAVAALACAVPGHALDPATPILAYLGFAAIGLALPLPVGNRFRTGRQDLFRTAAATGLLALWFAPELRTAAQVAPGVVFIAGVATATLWFRRGFSREWLRANADARFMPTTDSWMGDNVASQQALQKELWRTGIAGGRTWRRRTVGNSALAWLEVFFFESYGAIPSSRVAFGAALGIGLTSTLVFPLARSMAGPEAARIDAATAIYRLICDPSTLSPAFSVMAGSIVVMLFSLSSILVALPRSGQVYTISRAKLGRVAYLSTVANTVVLLASFLAGLLLIAWIAALVAGIRFGVPTTPRLLFAIVGALPLVPLWQWSAFAELTRRPGWVKCAAVAGLFVSVALGAVAAISPETFFSPSHLPLFVLAVLAGQLAHYAAVQRLFRTGDFVAARRQNPFGT